MDIVKKIHILNLAGELDDSLKSYFDEGRFNILTRGEIQDIKLIDYIFVKSVAQAKDASKDFDVETNEIKQVCLTEISDMKSFLLQNGRLVITPRLLEGDLGRSILEKFFFSKHNIHLADSFDNKFKETSEFSLTTHLSAGSSIDRVSYDAFEKGFNLVSLRSYMDHSLYYLSYLRQAGLAGIPYEFEYGSSEDFYAINIQTTVKNFVAEYILDSFGEVNSNDPLTYLIGVMNRSCDYLDITAIQNPSKIVFTAFWSKDRKKKITGTSFNNILTTAQVVAQVEKQLENYVSEEQVVQNQQAQLNTLKDKKLPGGIEQMNTTIEINSVLNQEPEQIQNVVNFASETIEMSMPDIELTNITTEKFEEILKKHPDQEFVNRLTDQDKEHLLERIQKKEMLEAYEAQLEYQPQADAPEQVAAVLEEIMASEVTNQILENIDLGLLESMMIDVPADPGMGAQVSPGAIDPLNGMPTTPGFIQEVPELGEIQAPQFQQMEAPVKLESEQTDEVIDISQLEALPGLAPLQSSGMPTVDVGDPFAAGDFNPNMPGDTSENAGKAPSAPSLDGLMDNVLPMPGIQMPDVEPIPAQIDLNTGEMVPIQMDPQTGEPAAVQVNPNTGQPVQAQVNEQGVPVQVMVNPQANVPVQVDPQPIQQPMQQAVGAEGMIPNPALQPQQPVVPIPVENLPPGVQQMVNPQTGQAMHVMVDPNSGMPVPVDVNPQTGEVTPIVQTQNNQVQPAQVEGASFGADMMPQMQPVPQGDAPPLVNTDELGDMGGLSSMLMEQGGMPQINAGDPFATGDFNPNAQQAQQVTQAQVARPQAAPLPDGIQAMVNPKTGETVHIMMDPNTGTPTPVDVNPQTGEVTPIVQPQVQGETVGATPVVETIVHPQTGQQVTVMNDPSSGEQIHMSVDPATGQPVQVDAVSGEPMQVNINQTINQTINHTHAPIPPAQPMDIPEDMDVDTFIEGMLEEGEPTLVVGGDPDDPDDFVQLLKGGEEEADDFVQTISELAEEEDGDFVSIISDNIIDKDEKSSFTIKGGDTKKEIEKMVARNLGSNAKLKDIDPKVKAFVRENAPGEIEKGLFRFAQNQGVNPDELTPEQIRKFQQEKMPEIMSQVIKDTNKVEDFAQKVAGAPSKTAEELKEDKRVIKALQQQAEQLKKIIQEKDDTNKSRLDPKNAPDASNSKDFEAQFKKKFQEKMKAMQEKMNSMQKELGQAKADARKSGQRGPQSKQEQMQNALKETVKDSFNEAFQNKKEMTPEQREAKEKEVVKGLAKTLNMPEEQVKNIVKEANAKTEEKEKEVVKQNSQAALNSMASQDEMTTVSADGVAASADNSVAQKALMGKLKQIELENKRLKDGMKAMKLKEEAKKKVEDKKNEINEKAKVSDKELDEKELKEENKINVPEPKVKVSPEEKQRIMEKVAKGEKLSEKEKQTMTQVMDSVEQSVKEIQKEAEKKLKKLTLESEKKETLFQAELDKATKAVKVKDFVLEKAKETMKTAVVKKEQEITQLKTQVQHLNQKLEGDESATIKQEAKELKKENESLQKMSEIYKAKLEKMAKSLSESKKGDNSAAIAEENKTLKRMKESLEKKMGSMEKQYKRMKEEYQTMSSGDNTLKSDFAKAKSEVKKQEVLIKSLKNQQKKMIEKMKKSQAAQEQTSQREVVKYKEQQAKLHKQLKVAETKLKEVSANAKNIDEKQLEANIAKKYQEQIQQAKKEMTVAKNQTQQLQAKIKELTTKLSGGAGANGKGGASPKEKKLEQDVKKLNGEISKIRNAAANHKKEVMAAKKEATGLKNQLAAMKKELEKAKKVAAGKKAA